MAAVLEAEIVSEGFTVLLSSRAGSDFLQALTAEYGDRQRQSKYALN